MLNLVHVVLGDALGLGLALLNRNIPPHQVSHYRLVDKVSLTRLFRLLLAKNIRDDKNGSTKHKKQYMRWDDGWRVDGMNEVSSGGGAAAAEVKASIRLSHRTGFHFRRPARKISGVQ